MSNFVYFDDCKMWALRHNIPIFMWKCLYNLTNQLVVNSLGYFSERRQPSQAHSLASVGCWPMPDSPDTLSLRSLQDTLTSRCRSRTRSRPMVCCYSSVITSVWIFINQWCYSFMTKVKSVSFSVWKNVLLDIFFIDIILWVFQLEMTENKFLVYFFSYSLNIRSCLWIHCLSTVKVIVM